MWHFIHCSLALLSFSLIMISYSYVWADSEISWNTFLGAAGDDYGQSVTADASGNLYVTGRTETSWGTPINAHAGGFDVFVAKLDSIGVLLWNTFLGPNNTGLLLFVDTYIAEGSGDLFVTGYGDTSWGVGCADFCPFREL